VFTGSRIQADVVAAALDAHGVRVQVYGDVGFGTGIGVNYADSGVMVPEDQAKAARKLIRDAESSRR